MPSEHDQLVNVLIDADTVVISIALVAGAVVVACERPRSSSGPATCGLRGLCAEQQKPGVGARAYAPLRPPAAR
jgi:hypothetical protein